MPTPQPLLTPHVPPDMLGTGLWVQGTRRSTAPREPMGASEAVLGGGEELSFWRLMASV